MTNCCCVQVTTGEEGTSQPLVDVVYVLRHRFRVMLLGFLPPAPTEFWKYIHKTFEVWNHNFPLHVLDTSKWIRPRFCRYLTQRHERKSVDAGFFKAGTPYTQYNPFGTPNNVNPGWAGHIGQDSPTQNASPDIDYVAMHLCASAPSSKTTRKSNTSCLHSNSSCQLHTSIGLLCYLPSTFS